MNKESIFNKRKKLNLKKPNKQLLAGQHEGSAGSGVGLSTISSQGKVSFL